MFEIAMVERMAPGPELAQVLLSVDVATLDADQAAAWAAASERLEAHVEARRYDAVARFADLSPYEPPPPPIVEGLDRPVQPGGEGTPEVSEFAAIGLGCALHSSTERAHGLIGHAFDLRHRHPQMFARLRAGEVPAFKVRMVLRASHSLSLLAARALDARIGARVARMGPKKLADEIDATLIAVDSAEAERRAASARRTRHVGVTHSSDGERRLYGWVGAFDGLAFDAALSKVADMLHDLGAAGTKETLRADAVGWLANPAATLALAARHRAWQAGSLDDEHGLPEWVRAVPVTRVDPDGVERLCPGVWDLETTTPAQALDPALWPSVTAVVHIPRSVWLGEHGPVQVDGHGPITAEQCFDRLRHSHIVVKPVVDLDDQPVSASDEFTGRLREAVLMANTFNPFPYADTRSRADDDIDHTIPRNRGGPTSIDNGGPLRRRQHRFKTHAEGWEVKQPFTGLFVWRTPAGRVYVVDRRGDTHDLGLAV